MFVWNVVTGALISRSKRRRLRQKTGKFQRLFKESVIPLRADAFKITPFTKKVMALVKQIPRGRVATYGQIAALAGKPHGARGVGWILNSSSETHGLPWQRVINSKGKISFSKRTDRYGEQKKLLLKEKVKFSSDDSVALEIYGWKKKSKSARRKNRGPQMFG